MSRKQGKRNQHKQEKKRREERAKLTARQTPLAYTGNKYRTVELVETHFHTEMGIFHADLISQRQLTDTLVESALRQLILELRHGRVPPREQSGHFEHEAGQEETLVSHCIRFHWQRLLANNAMPGRDSLVGVLRSILGSVETWKTAGTHSRGYLEYLEAFLRKAGVSEDSFTVERLDESMLEEEKSDEVDVEESWPFRPILPGRTGGNG